MSKVENYIQDYTKRCSNEIGVDAAEERPLYYPWLTPDHAREVAKIAREEVIEKVCKYLERNYEDIGIRWMRGYEADDLVEALKKELED